MLLDIPDGYKEIGDAEIVKHGDMCRDRTMPPASNAGKWALITEHTCLGSTGAFVRNKWPNHDFIALDPIVPVFKQGVRITDQGTFDRLLDSWPDDMTDEAKNSAFVQQGCRGDDDEQLIVYQGKIEVLVRF